MKSDRSAVFQLLAEGRIDGAEAERLLAALSADREAAWALAACLAIAGFAGLQVLAPGLAQAAKALLAGGMPFLHRALMLVCGWM
jgi:hypothetical protein